MVLQAPGDSANICDTAPEFELEGIAVPAKARSVTIDSSNQRNPGHYCVTFQLDSPFSLELKTFFHVGSGPIVRFKYQLLSKVPVHLTKTLKSDHLEYYTLNLLSAPKATEIRLSEFIETIHSFSLTECSITQEQWENSDALMGPLLACEQSETSLILGYEHGSQAPDAFLKYHLSPQHEVALRATKGNYYHGQKVDELRPFESIWFQLGANEGGLRSLAKSIATSF